MRLGNKILLALKILIKKNPKKFLEGKYYRNTVEYVPSTTYDNKLLADKNVLVTGAGPMIGSAIALEMAKQGANIYFTDIIEKRCANLESKLDSLEVKFKGFISDISVKEDNDKIVNYLTENNINIDILVNNVGVNRELEQGGIKNFDLETCKEIFDVNIIGPLHLTKLISQKMSENKTSGNIIFLTSVHQEIIGLWPIYSATKSGLQMIVKELAAELAVNKIRVNGIAPGWVKTNDEGNTVYAEKLILHNTSIEPAYIGRSAVYLASEYFSKHTTGTIIKIDSGQTLLPYNF